MRESLAIARDSRHLHREDAGRAKSFAARRGDAHWRHPSVWLASPILALIPLTWRAYAWRLSWKVPRPACWVVVANLATYGLPLVALQCEGER
jgi:hypothetical protein